MDNQDGFMLIEVLVTLTLFAILAVPLLGLLQMARETLHFAGLQTAALCLAQESLEIVRAQPLCMAESTAVEDVEGFAGFSRELQVTEKTVTGGLPMKVIRVIVYWQQGQVLRQVTLVTWQGGR